MHSSNGQFRRLWLRRSRLLCHCVGTGRTSSEKPSQIGERRAIIRSCLCRFAKIGKRERVIAFARVCPGAMLVGTARFLKPNYFREIGDRALLIARFTVRITAAFTRGIVFG